MNAELKVVQDNLKKKQDQLAEVIAKVDALQTTLDETLAEKKRLEDAVELTGNRLQRAEKLTVGLADEQVRWAASVETLGEQIERLVGDIFISAACISYYGPFTGTYRTQMVRGLLLRVLLCGLLLLIRMLCALLLLLLLLLHGY